MRKKCMKESSKLNKTLKTLQLCTFTNINNSLIIDCEMDCIDYSKQFNIVEIGKK